MQKLQSSHRFYGGLYFNIKKDSLSSGTTFIKISDSSYFNIWT
jgi:hypothetical protein